MLQAAAAVTSPDLAPLSPPSCPRQEALLGCGRRSARARGLRGAQQHRCTGARPCAAQGRAVGLGKAGAPLAAGGP